MEEWKKHYNYELWKELKDKKRAGTITPEETDTYWTLNEEKRIFLNNIWRIKDIEEAGNTSDVKLLTKLGISSLAGCIGGFILLNYMYNPKFFNKAQRSGSGLVLPILGFMLGGYGVITTGNNIQKWRDKRRYLKQQGLE